MASQQRRRMPDTNPNGYTNPDCDGYAYSDRDSNTNSNSHGYADGNCYSYGDTHRDPASAYPKAAAHAVASADAVRGTLKGRVTKLKRSEAGTREATREFLAFRVDRLRAIRGCVLECGGAPPLLGCPLNRQRARSRR
jgi:hypothetical protein